MQGSIWIILLAWGVIFLGCGSEPEPVSITSPEFGSTVSGIVMVKVSTHGSVDHVHFYFNGAPYDEDPDAPYEYEWDTSHELNGSYTIQSEAHFTSGDQKLDEISVTVNN